jgi:hypothetical protein
MLYNYTFLHYWKLARQRETRDEAARCRLGREAQRGRQEAARRPRHRRWWPARLSARLRRARSRARTGAA